MAEKDQEFLEFVVRGLVELHGGRAWLESEQGKGARAYIVLPQGPNGNLQGEDAAVAA